MNQTHTRVGQGKSKPWSRTGLSLGYPVESPRIKDETLRLSAVVNLGQRSSLLHFELNHPLHVAN